MIAWLATAWAAEPVRLAVILSADRGLAGEEPLLYANRDAERVGALLGELGGFGPGDVWLVPNATSEDVTATLARVTVRASEIAAAGGETLLLVYYAGHAGSDGLHLGGDTLALTSLKTAARVVPAATRLFVVDACQAGQIARSRGATLLAVTDAPTAFAPPADEAWIASSGPEERSFEVEDRRGALFTHFFLSGARGAADLDGDGVVALGELYSFTQRQTAATAAELGYLQQPRWAGALGGLALTTPGRSTSGVHVDGPISQPILLVNRATGEVAAEIPVGAGSDLALPPGRYQAIAPRDSGVLVGEVDVGAWDRWQPELELHHLRVGVRTRGGLVDPHPLALSAGYRAAIGATPGRPDGHAAWLALDRATGRGHHLLLVTSGGVVPYTTAWWEGVNRSLDVRAGWRVDVLRGDVELGPGVTAGAGVLSQTTRRTVDPLWGDWYGTAAAQRAATVLTLGAEAGVGGTWPLGPVGVAGWLGGGPQAALGQPAEVVPALYARLGIEVGL